MLSPGRILKAVDFQIRASDDFLSRLKSQTDWHLESFMLPFPCYLADHTDKVRYLLVDMGQVGASSLRRIAGVNFREFVGPHLLEPNGGGRRWVPTPETLRKCSRLMEKVKVELLRVRAKLLGVRRSGAVKGKKRPGSIGRPLDVHINKAMDLLKNGLRKNRAIPDPRGRWDSVFNSDVVPYFEKEVWPTMPGSGTDKQRKKEIANLKNAVRARGGIGIPPKKTPRKIN